MHVIRVILIALIVAVVCCGAGCSWEEAEASDIQVSSVEEAEQLQAEKRKEREEFIKNREATAEKLRKKLEQYNDKMNQEYETHVKEFEAKRASTPKRRTRRFRRYKWESSDEIRSRLWNVPEEETEQALLTAFLRVCIAESGGYIPDCIGIWQVINNNKNRSCNRGLVRKITECEDGEGETLLSSIRRHQRHALGYMPPRNYRATWISKLETDCEPPSTWRGARGNVKNEERLLDEWDAHVAPRCRHVVEAGRYLIKGELPPRRPGVPIQWIPGKPIAWGGRCEDEKASCDDKTACALGYARIPSTNTKNAFWCRLGRAGCRKDPEPICVQLGLAKAPEKEEEEVIEEASEKVVTPEDDVVTSESK